MTKQTKAKYIRLHVHMIMANEHTILSTSSVDTTVAAVETDWRAHHLRIDDRRLRKRDAERRACIANCVVGAFPVHYEANVPPWRRDAEQVGRGYECGTVIIVMMMSTLLQLVGVFHEAVMNKGVARRGGGQGEGTRTPKPHQ